MEIKVKRTVESGKKPDFQEPVMFDGTAVFVFSVISLFIGLAIGANG